MSNTTVTKKRDYKKQDFYDILHLKTIKGVNFTKREIDVIACILSGKSVKKLAIFLLISPKTVENHIHNIMLKLECKSQESIIDFIETSDKFLLIRKHYLNLLIQFSFTLELKAIAKLIVNHNYDCFIMAEKVQEDDVAILERLTNDLKVAGFKLSVAHNEKNDFYFKDVGKIERTHIVYILATSVTNKIQECATNSDKENIKKPDITEIFNKNLCAPVLFISFEPPDFDGFLKSRFSVDPLIFSSQKNYYYFIFEVLKRLLPNLNIDRNILNFKEKYKKYHNESDFQTPSKNDVGLFKTIKITFKKNLNNLLKIITIFTFSLIFLFLSLNKIKKNGTISVCTGLGGVGKTQLALYYIHQDQHSSAFKGWFYAENIAQLKQQYIELAKVLGYKEENPSFESVLPYVKDWFSKNSDWLLVYDNVTSYKDIKDFLPETPGNIILTTRQRHWPNTFNTLEVNVMTQEEALQLIESITLHKINTEDHETVKKITEKLGFLPLALAQASAHIRNNGIGFKEYLERYNHAEQKMLDDHALPEGTKHVPVSVTWNTNFDAIRKEAIQQNIPLLSLQIMTICAYLEPNKISKAFLLSWLKKTYPKQENAELILDQLLGLLNRYSLIMLDSNEEMIDIHRLVQAVLRNKHSQIDPYNPSLSQSWYETILNIAHEEFTRKTVGSKDDQRQQALLPHLQSLMSHYENLNLNPKSTMLALVSFDIGASLAYKEPLLSKRYLEQSLRIFKQKYGSNHLNVSRTLRYLGNIYCALGDIKQSQELWEKALRIDEKIHSNEITMTLNNLSVSYGILGRVEEQRKQLERVLKMIKQSPNVTPRQIAGTLHTLGTAYIASGEAIKGKSTLERSLEIFEKEYGQDYFVAGTVLTSLGHANWVLGNLNQAKSQLERSLKIKSQYYHTEHIAIGISLNNLGNVHKNLGDVSQAHLCLEKALKISEQHYGKDHLATAIILNNLGELYQATHNTNKSQPLFIRAKELKKAYNIGEISLNYATAYGALGDVNHKKLSQMPKS